MQTQIVFLTNMFRGNGAVGNPSDVTLFNLSQISFLPVNELDMVAATRTDPRLGTVLKMGGQ